MRIGIPTELKDNERRVGMIPDGVAQLVKHGHEVVIQSGAGEGSGYLDVDYVSRGATIGTQKDVWDCDLVVKVKEPIESEYPFLREDLVLFCYLHLAAEPELTRALVDAGTTAIAFETVTSARGDLPLLTPMSEIAGRLSVQTGAQLLTAPAGGPGMLLGGIAGVAPVNVTVVGGGVAGAQAVDVAVGLGAQVTVLDINTATLRAFNQRYEGKVRTIASTPDNIAEELRRSHLVIGSVLVPGAKAPKVVTEEHLRSMPEGAVVVDIAIDQGGCTAASQPTSHSNPIFSFGPVTMYCVTNMPGAAPKTATIALANETLPFVVQLANQGAEQALQNNIHLKAGLNVAQHEVVHEAVKDALGL
ncbi:alanine dehydrogenase [Corynebacterium aquilae]|uniref:Alanine dehydrogenase n=1 Tax=Corynebacterium aquilae DSM 44791 TaxID=1431546 RepID=A0A1L7CG27_9CORY|nr:alanine dehydrogenase [Corynebacterium aquilae]APT84788.1 alanine dehydrogenase [Corynebacterium aquilae DSM 44791]